MGILAGRIPLPPPSACGSSQAEAARAVQTVCTHLDLRTATTLLGRVMVSIAQPRARLGVSGSTGDRPGRGALCWRPARPCARKRARQRATHSRSVRQAQAMAAFARPAAARRMIRARRTSQRGTRHPRDQRASVTRSAGVRIIGWGDGPGPGAIGRESTLPHSGRHQISESSSFGGPPPPWAPPGPPPGATPGRHHKGPPSGRGPSVRTSGMLTPRIPGRERLRTAQGFGSGATWLRVGVGISGGWRPSPARFGR